MTDEARLVIAEERYRDARTALFGRSGLSRWNFRTLISLRAIL